jgi:hypothetical protein
LLPHKWVTSVCRSVLLCPSIYTGWATSWCARFRSRIDRKPQWMYSSCGYGRSCTWLQRKCDGGHIVSWSVLCMALCCCQHSAASRLHRCARNVLSLTICDKKKVWMLRLSSPIRQVSRRFCEGDVLPFWRFIGAHEGCKMFSIMSKLRIYGTKARGHLLTYKTSLVCSDCVQMLGVNVGEWHFVTTNGLMFCR